MFVKNEFPPFEKKVWLATPTPHPEMMEFIQKAYTDNWLTTAGENLMTVEEQDRIIAVIRACFE